MRDFLIFVAILAAVFFGIGEWQGWYLGIPGQTPVFVYKKDAAGELTRRTINRNDFPFEVSGTVRRGKVTVEGYYQQGASFQANTPAGPEQRVFKREYGVGQRIDLQDTMRQGTGYYRIRLVFEDATGLFRVKVPRGSEL
jgi:hypothetical protein